VADALRFRYQFVEGGRLKAAGERDRVSLVSRFDGERACSRISPLADYALRSGPGRRADRGAGSGRRRSARACARPDAARPILGAGVDHTAVKPYPDVNVVVVVSALQGFQMIWIAGILCNTATQTHSRLRCKEPHSAVERTAEDRGVPGSSPGLAIRSTPPFPPPLAISLGHRDDGSRPTVSERPHSMRVVGVSRSRHCARALLHPATYRFEGGLGRSVAVRFFSPAGH